MVGVGKDRNRFHDTTVQAVTPCPSDILAQHLVESNVNTPDLFICSDKNLDAMGLVSLTVQNVNAPDLSVCDVKNGDDSGTSECTDRNGNALDLSILNGQNINGPCLSVCNVSVVLYGLLY